nr:hypothetical protein [Pandoravirus massiliensis]
MEQSGGAYWYAGQGGTRGRKRAAEVALGPSIRDVAAGVCMALRRGQPVDPRAAQLVVETARAEGALGSDMDVLFAACSAGMASMALTPTAARSGLAPAEWSGSYAGTVPSPTLSSPYEQTLRQPMAPSRADQQLTPPTGRKRRAEEALTPARSARDLAVDICRRAYRGEVVSPDEVEALREIARAEGSVGARLIRDVPGLCRAALTLMGESPTSMAALAGASMRGRRPVLPPVATAPCPQVVRLNLAPRAERFS